MSKLDDKIALYTKFVADKKLGVDIELLTKVTKGLGPSIYLKDAESISCGDPSELNTVKKNFLQKKLGLDNSEEELDAMVKEICVAIGTSVRNKYRAVFYTMLVEKLGKQEVYA